MATSSRSEADRFWAKVRPEPGNRCWLWAAGVSSRGYGAFNLRRAHRRIDAHRWSWEHHYGPIPDGLWVLHRCDVRRCVNPAHLFLGTAADNNADCAAKGRKPYGERHGLAKLTDSVVAEIKRLHAAGPINQRELARKHSVSTSTIHQIVHGRTWIKVT